MADYWDDPGIWETPAPETPINSGGGGTPAPAPGTPAPAGLKAKSWGTSSGGTAMPSWFQDWAKSFWGSPVSGGGAQVQPGREAQIPGQNWLAGTYGGNGDAFTGAIGSPNPAGGTGGMGGQGFNMMNDAYQRYFAGGPRYQGQTDQMVNQLPNVWSQYQQLPGQIENKRQAMIDQLYAGLPRMRELYQPAMEGMSQRGILNSSVTGDALSRIQDQVNQGLLGQSAAANTWAADQGINYTTNMPTVLNNVINGLMSASNSNANFGKEASAIGGNYQTLMNQLAEMLKAQQSKQEQGSETYNV